MAQIIREITLDVSQPNNLRAITAKQNDLNSRFLKIHITDEGNPILVDGSSQVIMNVQRTDNAVRPFYGSVNNDGSVTVPLTPWMLYIEGSINCDVSIISTEDLQRLTTLQFSIYVEKAIFPQEALEESEDYDVFLNLLSAAEDAQKCVEATEEAKVAAERAEEAAEGVVIIEQNKKAPLTFWVGTKEEYDALAEPVHGCFYIISDDSDLEDINNRMAAMQNAVSNALTPYDISSAVVPEDSYSEYTLIKYGKLLILNYSLKTEPVTESIGESIYIDPSAKICTIQNYVPVCTSYCTFNNFPQENIGNSYNFAHAIQLEASEDGKSTVVSFHTQYRQSLFVNTGNDLLGHFTAMFICK